IEDISAHLDVIHVTLFALLADAVSLDAKLKSRLLITMRAVRDHPATIPQLTQAYNRAIDLIESLQTLS
ncbi:hypothetical protein, partial [Candidatus Binatus sp.]|uniref:hypothetical protein n=1 Tax=Candidatus Binatus sp. TaxID=2811406 RepID=UPI003C69445E